MNEAGLCYHKPSASFVIINRGRTFTYNKGSPRFIITDYRFDLLYCKKVLQTIIAEYRSLRFRYIDDISAIYRTY